MSEGKKYDQDKLKVELLYNDLVNELESVAKVLSFGATKYGARNWRGVSKERYGAALIRHYNASVKGERLDPESGQSHLAHAICCALFMLYIENNESVEEEPSQALDPLTQAIEEYALRNYEEARGHSPFSPYITYGEI